MLKIFFGHIWNLEIDPKVWVKYGLESPKLITENDMCKKIIKGIDGSDAISGDLVISPILGGIPVERLSGGCLSVLFMYLYKPDKNIYNGTDAIINIIKCGENCYPYIVEVAKKKDIVISASMFPNFYKYGYQGSILVLNDNSVVSNQKDLFEKFDMFCEDEL